MGSRETASPALILPDVVADDRGSALHQPPTTGELSEGVQTLRHSLGNSGHIQKLSVLLILCKDFRPPARRPPRLFGNNIWRAALFLILPIATYACIY